MLFDAAALASLRATQESTMMHECIIEPYIVGGDGTISYGSPVTTVCGFKAITKEARMNGELYDTEEADAELRLPLSLQIGMHDRVTLTKSFGRGLNPPLYFDVIGLPDSFGPSGHVVRVKEVYA